MQQLQNIVQQQAQALGVLEGRLANQPDANERRLGNARRCMSYMPTFARDRPFRTFELEFKSWVHANDIEAAGHAFAKSTLLSAMKGPASEHVRPYGLDTDVYNNAANLTAYLEILRNLFTPAAEAEVIRAEFRTRRQEKNEDISTYINAKISLWQLAFPAAQRSFPILLHETVKGMRNPVAQRQLMYANPADENEMIRHAVRIVAVERECYQGGFGQTANLDGLRSITLFEKSKTDESEAMDIDKVDGRRGCWNCGKPGHHSKDCRQPKKSQAPSRPQQGTKKGGKKGGKLTCFHCGKEGHLQKNCFKKQAKQTAGKRTVKAMEDGDDDREDAFLEEIEED